MIAKFRTQRLAGSIFPWLLILVVALLAAPPTTCGCPFCSMQGQTLTGEVNQASMVLFGTLANAKLNPAGFESGSTDLQIDAVIKKHEILGDKKVIVLPRYVPTDKNMSKFLVFCDVFKGKIDPYRGIPVKSDSDIVKYLQGALAVKDKDVSARLRFFFDYLDNADLEIANDAYKEFGNADYKDYRDMAKDLPGDKIAKWLQDPATPAFRHGLYASMLGHCGNDKHAEVLRKLLDDAQKQAGTGVDGMLAGYTMLKPKEGWPYIRDILKDPKKEFMLRYAALRAIRFFWNSRPDLVPEKDLVEGVKILLDQGDIADLAIEDLRLHRCWEAASQVLDLYGKKSHDVPIIRRYIVRYALSCPKKEAKEFVIMMRQKDPEMVKDIEEFLKLETPAPSPPTASQPTAKPVAGK
jgi:hypothetical protein